MPLEDRHVNVKVNFNVAIDANSKVTLLGVPPPTVTNVIVAQAELDVKSLYDADNQKGLIEIWEPSDALGDIKCQLANTDSSGNEQGGPDLTGAYQVVCKTFAQGLQAVLCDKFDCSGVTPFNNAKYNAQEAYTLQRDFGRVALATFAHYLFGHVDATAAITNDIAFVHHMLSINAGGADESETGADTRAAAWLKSVTGDVETWDATATQEDANLALRLVEAVVAKGKDGNGELAISSVQNATTETLSNIVKQVIGQDSSRTQNVDGSERTRNQHQLLRFYPNDVIYMNIVIQSPTVEVSNDSASGNAPSGSLSSNRSFTLKIKLKDTTDPFLYTDGTKTVISGYQGTVPSALVIASGVTGIADDAFLNATGLQTIELPAGLLTIGARAFKGCTSLTTINIPSSVLTIGEAAFEGCTSLASAYLPGQGTKALPRVTMFGTKATPARFMKKRSVPSSSTAVAPVPAPAPAPKLALARRSLARARLLSTTYSTIAPSLFKDCTSLATVALPPGIVIIHASAFQGCSTLTSISISNVTSIGASAFEGAGLTSITIPAGINNLAANIFKDCVGLTTVSIPSNVGTIGGLAFYGCTGLTAVTMAEGVTSIHTQAFQECTGLTALEFPSTVTAIATRAFLGCSALATVLAPTTVTITNTPLNAFPNATVLTYFDPATSFKFSDIEKTTLVGYKGTVPSSLSIPSSVTSIAANVFQGVSALTSVTIPSSVASIGASAFAGTGLTSADVPATATLGASAFDAGVSITVTTIGNRTIPVDASGNMLSTGYSIRDMRSASALSFINPEDLSGFVFNMNGFNYGSTIRINTHGILGFTNLVGTGNTVVSSTMIGIAYNAKAGLISDITYFRTTTADYDIVTIQIWFENTISELTGATDYRLSSGQVQMRLIKKLSDGTQYIELATNKGSSAQITNLGQWAVANGVTLVTASEITSVSQIFPSSGTASIVFASDASGTSWQALSGNRYINLNLDNSSIVPTKHIVPVSSPFTAGNRTVPVDASGNMVSSGHIIQTNRGITPSYTQIPPVDLSGFIFKTVGANRGSSIYVSATYVIGFVPTSIGSTIFTGGTIPAALFGTRSGAVNRITYFRTTTAEYDIVTIQSWFENSSTDTTGTTDYRLSSGQVQVRLIKNLSDGTQYIEYTTNKGSSDQIASLGQWAISTGINRFDFGALMDYTAADIFPSSGTKSILVTSDADGYIWKVVSGNAYLDVNIDNSVFEPTSAIIPVTAPLTSGSRAIPTDASGNMISYGNPLLTTSSTSSTQQIPAADLSGFMFSMNGSRGSIRVNTHGLIEYVGNLGISSSTTTIADNGYRRIAYNGGATLRTNRMTYFRTTTAEYDIVTIQRWFENSSTGTTGTTDYRLSSGQVQLRLIKSLSDAMQYIEFTTNKGSSAQITNAGQWAISDGATLFNFGALMNFTAADVFPSSGTKSILVTSDPNGYTWKVVSGNAYLDVNTTNTARNLMDTYLDPTWGVSLFPNNASTNTSQSRGMKIDSAGNIYVCGYGTIAGTVFVQNILGNADTQSSVKLEANSTGNYAYLIKYNSSGIAQWATYFDGTGTDMVLGLAFDSSTNIYVTGQYSSTSAITLRNASGNGQVASTTTLPIASTAAVFLVKYNTDGITQWATCFNGTGADIGRPIAVDSDNNIYIGGEYSSTSAVTLQDASGTTQRNSPTGIALPIVSGAAAFLVKYNANGIAQWATYIRGSNIAIGYGIAIDSTNSVYFTGQYQSSSAVTLQDVSGTTQRPSPTGIALPITSSAAIFLVKYNPNGISQWATRIEGTGSDIGFGIAIDSTNSVYITGQYNSSSAVILQDASGGTQRNSPTGIALPISTNAAAFLVKYNANGITQWATHFNGTGNDIGRGIAIDSTNSVYITGQYWSSSAVTLQDASGATQRNSPTGIALPIIFTDTVFLVKYNANGITQWATHFNGTGSNIGYGIAVSGSSIYLSGVYNTTSTIVLQDASGSTQQASALSLQPGAGDASFVVQYSTGGIVEAASTCLSTAQVSGSTTVPSRMANDASGNVYIIGDYLSATPIPVQNRSGFSEVASNITLPSTYAGGSIRTFSYIIKYDASGVAQWATVVSRSSTITSSNNNITSIAVDASNAVYVGGRYGSTGPITLSDASENIQVNSTVTLPTASTGQGFLIKYNANGVAQWATTFSSTVFGVAVDTSCVYVTGGQTIPNSTLQNASGPGQSPSDVTNTVSGGRTVGIYLCKYDADGFAVWATNIDTIGGFAGSFYNTLVVDSTNSIYLATPVSDGPNQIILNNANGTGQAPSTVTIPPLSSTSSSMLLVKYNQDGIVQWATYANPGTSMIPYKIAVDSSNDIYITGVYRSAAAVVLQDANGGTQQPSAISLPLNSTDAAFLIKYNANGVVQWGVHLDGSGADSALGLAIDGNKNVYITGFHNQSSGTLAVQNATSSGQVASSRTLSGSTVTRHYLIKYNSNGQCLIAITNGFSTGTSNMRGVDIQIISNTLYYIAFYSQGRIAPANLYAATGIGNAFITSPGQSCPVLVQAFI